MALSLDCAASGRAARMPSEEPYRQDRSAAFAERRLTTASKIREISYIFEQRQSITYGSVSSTSSSPLCSNFELDKRASSIARMKGDVGAWAHHAMSSQTRGLHPAARLGELTEAELTGERDRLVSERGRGASRDAPSTASRADKSTSCGHSRRDAGNRLAELRGEAGDDPGSFASSRSSSSAAGSQHRLARPPAAAGAQGHRRHMSNRSVDPSGHGRRVVQLG